MNEILVLVPILTLGFIISSRLSGASNNYELLAYLPMGIFSSIGFVTIFELGIRTSPYGKMINASALAVIIIGILIIGKGIKVFEFQLLSAAIFIAAMAGIILLIKNIGLVVLTPDSYATLANASYFRDAIPISFGNIPAVVKRSVTYPVLNGLMERDTFLVALAPILNLVFIAQIMGAIYLFRRFLDSVRVAACLAVILLVSFLSMYQVQSNFFYINTHTLVAGSITSLAILGIIWKHRFPSRIEMFTVSGIGIALSLCRPEGYLIFIVSLIGIIAISEIGSKEIIQICMLPLLGNVLWYSTLILSFHEGGEALSILIIDLALTLGIIVLSGGYFKTQRNNFLLISILTVGVIILAMGAREPNEFLKGIRNCLYNYYQNWGIPLLWMATLTAIAVISRRKYPLAGYFGLFGLNIYLFSVFAKLSDGGAGKQIMICRIGWGDSLNRSFMHLMGLVLLSSIFILTEKNVKNSELQNTLTH